MRYITHTIHHAHNTQHTLQDPPYTIHTYTQHTLQHIDTQYTLVHPTNIT